MKYCQLCLFLCLLLFGVTVFGGEISRVTVAQADIFGPFKSALGQFEVDVGRYPTTAEGLAALIQCPTNLLSSHWHGPYLDKIPVDPWGTPYGYIGPGVHNPNAYDLYSCGADGISKTHGNDLDDINNWDPSSPHGGRDYDRPGLPLAGVICLVVGLAGVFTFAFNWFWEDAKGKPVSTRKMWEGILSAFWLPLVFVLLMWLNHCLRQHVSLGLILAELVVWLGVGLLLALSGLRSSSRIGIAAGLAAIFEFLYLLWIIMVPHAVMRT